MVAEQQVFVGFFGITRSLRHTADSIHANILTPLRTGGAIVRAYGHFHLPPSIDNPRSGENAVPPDAAESGLLPLAACLMEGQDESLIAEDYAYVRTQPDILQDGYRSARNLCFQLRSLSRLWSLMMADAEFAAAGGDAWVVFLRPDLRYLDPLPWQEVTTALQQSGAGLAVPSWHGWGGLNDRFAIATPRAAAQYATRITLLREAVALHSGLHGESLLALAVERAKLSVLPIPLRALRIRADGRPEARDLTEFGVQP